MNGCNTRILWSLNRLYMASICKRADWNQHSVETQGFWFCSEDALHVYSTTPRVSSTYTTGTKEGRESQSSPEVFSSYVVRDYYWCVSHQCSSTFLAVKLWCIKKPQEVYLVRRSRVSVRERGEGRQGVSCMEMAMLNVTKENIKLYGYCCGEYNAQQYSLYNIIL